MKMDEVLEVILDGLQEARHEARWTQYSLFHLHKIPEYANLAGVYVLLTEVTQRLQAACEAVEAEIRKDK